MPEHKTEIQECANFGMFRAFSWRWVCSCGLTGQWQIARNVVEKDAPDHENES